MSNEKSEDEIDKMAFETWLHSKWVVFVLGLSALMALLFELQWVLTLLLLVGVNVYVLRVFWLRMGGGNRQVNSLASSDEVPCKEREASPPFPEINNITTLKIEKDVEGTDEQARSDEFELVPSAEHQSPVERALDGDARVDAPIKVLLPAQALATDEHSEALVTLSAYSKNINDVMFDLIEMIMSIYKRSHAAIYRTEQMVKRVDGTFDVLDDVRSVADETSLLALNVFFDSAYSGHTGRGSMTLAQEVCKLAQHSVKFTQDIRNEVNLARKTINEVKDLITRTADKELHLTLKSKEIIDQQLGRMALLEQLMLRQCVESQACSPSEETVEVGFSSREYCMSEVTSALQSVTGALSDMNKRVCIIMSKKAISDGEAERLKPVLALANRLQQAKITREECR